MKKSRRKKVIKGTASRPRLIVFRSNNHIYGQVVDDNSAHTLISCSTLDPEIKSQLTNLSKIEMSQIVGQSLGKKLLENNISTLIFDKGIRPYHGRIKAFAESVKEVGLNF